MMNLKGSLQFSIASKPDNNMIMRKLSIRRIFILILIFIVSPFCKGQYTDTIAYRPHSTRNATIMSAIVPGLGQIYNNKVWKIPLLYGGAGIAIYQLNRWQQRYDEVLSILKTNYKKEDFYFIYGRSLQGTSLERARDQYRRNRDYSLFTLGGIYLLNIIDATVDAYMFEYDISDDLSFEIKPDYIPADFNLGGAGLSFCLKF